MRLLREFERHVYDGISVLKVAPSFYCLFALEHEIEFFSQINSAEILFPVLGKLFLVNSLEVNYLPYRKESTNLWS